MPNETLEKNQAETFDSIVAKYFFTAKGGGVTEPVKSPEKEALKPGIRLHFFRYGLFDRNADGNNEEDVSGPSYTDESKQCNAILIKDEKPEHFVVKQSSTDQKSIELSEVEVLSLKDLPNLENFHVARTAVNTGYIYLMNDEDPDDCYELYVNESGQLQYILWENNKGEDGEYLDQRKPSGKKWAYKLVKPGKKLWVAYSPIQWSRQYHHELNTNADKREKRMKLIDCSGIKKGEEDKQEDVLSFKDVKAVFPKGHPRAFPLKDMLDDILADEKKQDSTGDNEVFEDMFVSLHDPIGCALDVSAILGTQITRQKAMIESIQTGRDLDIVYNRMLTGEKIPPPSVEEEQIGAMVNLALAQYQLIYSNSEMIDDYDGGKIGWGSGIYKPKLLNILGVEDRKKQRAVIRSLQNDLGVILDTDYYKKAYIDAEEGTKLNCIDGKFFAAQPLKLLAIKPHLQDKTFDLKQDIEEDTKWDYLILNSLKEDENAPVYRVLNKEVNIDEETIKQGIDLSNKLAAFVTASLETYAKYAIEDITETLVKETVSKETVKGNYQLTVKRLNTIKVRSEDMFEVRGYEVREQIQSAGWEIDNGKVVAGTYKGKKDIYRWIRTKSPELVLKETSRGRHVFDVPVTKEVEEIIRTEEYITRKQSTKLGTKATAVLEGAPFRGVVALLQVFNIGAAYHTFSKDKSLKNFISLSGISAELTAATGFFVEKALERTVKETVIKSTGRLAMRANIVGAGVTVIMCTWDACLSFDARDKDAGLAWAGAAAAFTGVTVAAIFASASWAGPLGWACAGIGVGLVFLAYYLKDSPLETFFKNNVLSDEVDFLKLSNDNVGTHNKRFYKDRNITCPDTDYQKWNNFKFAGAELTDLIVCSTISFKPTLLINKTSTNTGLLEAALGKHETKESGYIKKFEIAISFRQFLQSKDQLAYTFYFFKDGFNSKPEEILTKPIIRVEEAKQKQPPRVILDLEVPLVYINNYNKNSKLLLVSALSLGDNKFYPTKYNEDTRLLGAYVSVFQTITTTTTRMGRSRDMLLDRSNTAIKPLNQLLSGTAWKE